MVIRAHMRGVAEVDLSLFPVRQSFDPREFLLKPLLHQRFVPFQCTMQRLLKIEQRNSCPYRPASREMTLMLCSLIHRTDTGS
jgi:hypothetical protein